jgi:hypothetical protein
MAREAGEGGGLRALRGRPPRGGGAAEEGQGADLGERLVIAEEDGGAELVIYRAAPSEAGSILFAESLDGKPKLVVIFFEDSEWVE